MKVNHEVDAVRYHPPDSDGSIKIQFGIPSEGGNSSAGEKYDFEEKAVRLAWWNSEGGFDPISTAELPEWALLDVIEASAQKDFFEIKDIAILMKALATSLERKIK